MTFFFFLSALVGSGFPIDRLVDVAVKKFNLLPFVVKLKKKRVYFIF